MQYPLTMGNWTVPKDRPFKAAEAFAGGVTGNDLRQAVRSGYLIRLRKQVFVVAGYHAVANADPRSAHALQVHALMLAMSRRNIAAAGLSAARIHGLDLLPGAAQDLVVCTADPGVSGTHRDGYYLRKAPLPADEVQVLHGIPVTTPARTLLDLAANLEFRAALAAADSAYRLHLICREDLDSVLDKRVKRPGIEQAREVFAFAQPGSESALESVSRAAMRELQIPIPRLQVYICEDFRPYVRTDFDWWPELDLSGEADGMKKYLPPEGADRAAVLRAIRDEKARERRILQKRGELVRWGWREAMDSALLGAILLPAIARAGERKNRSA